MILAVSDPLYSVQSSNSLPEMSKLLSFMVTLKRTSVSQVRHCSLDLTRIYCSDGQRQSETGWWPKYLNCQGHGTISA
jgi:hypothetical protein